jgi:alcohol-forming fatty acyl-CoA reductase
MADEWDFYRRQVVFLTGGTGGVGGSLLYTLAVTLRVPKIYVLIRSSPEVARRRLTSTLRHCASQVFRTGAVRFVAGDVTLPSFGLSPTTVAQFEREVTVVIHSAANTSFKAPLRTVVRDNTLPALELARMTTRFAKLVSHVQLSTSYAMSCLPDGPVEERIYPIEDVEQVLQDIISGRITDFGNYAWPYARSKHLMECLLAKRFPRHPILVVRASAIGPSLQTPFELYGPIESLPISHLYARLMRPVGGTSIFHASAEHPAGTNILDEIPMDLCVNLIMQHIQRGTTGIVHAVSRSYIPRTLRDRLEDLDKWMPEDEERPRTKVVFTTDRSQRQSSLAEAYAALTRNWLFLNDQSRDLKLSGPLSMSFSGHDLEQFNRIRLSAIAGQTKSNKGATLGGQGGRGKSQKLSML